MEIIFDPLVEITLNGIANTEKTRQWMAKNKLFKYIINCTILMIANLKECEQTDSNKKLHDELSEALKIAIMVSNCKMITCGDCVSEDDICQTCTATNDSYKEKILSRFYNKLVNGIIMSSAIVQRNAELFELIHSTILTIQTEIDHTDNSQILCVLLLKFKGQILALSTFMSGVDSDEKISIYSNTVMAECKYAVQEYIQLGETNSEDLRNKLTTILNM